MPLRRLGEAAQPNSQTLLTAATSSDHDMQTGSSQYTAPASQGMHVPCHTTILAAAAQPEQLQEVGQPSVDGQKVADVPSCIPQRVGPTGQGGAGQGSAGQSSKQSSLGRQLGDALKLRNWKPDGHANLRLVLPAESDGVTSKPALSLSPRTESAMMVAASELGFDAMQSGCLELSAKPILPSASRSATVGSAFYPRTVD